ncbi:MAG: sensor histidine kinase [Elusimicrobiales bacterium]
MKKFKFRLLHKFVAVLVLVSVLPMTLLGLRLIKLGQTGVINALMELHQTSADKLASEINGYIKGADAALRSAMAAMAQMDWENKQTMLSAMLETRREIKQVSVLSKDGAEIIRMLSPYGGGEEALSRYGADEGFKAARKGSRHISMDPKTRFAVLYYPFGKDMALRAELDFPDFIASMDLRRVGAEGFPVVLDASGSPIAWPPAVTEEAALEAAAWEFSVNAVKSLSSGSSEIRSSSGRELLAAQSPIRELGGAVVVSQPRSEAYKYAMFMQRQAVYVVLVFLALAIAAGWFLSRSLTKPIMALTRAAGHVAAGDFSRKAEVRTSDELNDLAETFNEMTFKLKEYSDLQVDRIIREQKNTEAILFSTEDGILMADMAGRVQVANRAARSVLGIAPEVSVEGRLLEGLISSEAVREVVLDVFGSRKENYFREIQLTQETSERFFKCFSTPIVAPGHEEPIGRLIGFYDITLDKQLAKMKDEFLHSITHDLRNPMGAIKGFVEFMLKEIPGPVNEAQKKMLVSIDRASFRLLGMINNILDSAKMEAGKMEISLAPVNLREIAIRVNSLLESLGQRKSIRFELEGDENVVVNADAGLMERMFTNLIGNAVKFTPENGVITTGIRDDGDKVTAWVRDTGDGIPPEYIDKVFEKFEQVKGQKAGGTGIGLTVCKFVAGAHLGKVWVESEVGHGARFIFSFPKNLAKDGSGKVVAKGVS